jgi:8-oxo-dGTP pyrophosphatase MutT (NUDIX family)/deoxyadenosine/deoxycytidine kinase
VKPGSNKSPLFTAVGCVVWHEHKMLLLRRSEAKSYPACWGLPSGKVERDETNLKAAIRELYEETQILLSGEQLDLFGTYFIETDDMLFEYGVFLHVAGSAFSVTLNAVEHTSFGWFTVREAVSLKLVPKLKEILEEVESALSPSGQLQLFEMPSIGSRSGLRRIESMASKRILDAPVITPLGPVGTWYVAIGPPGAGKSTMLRGIREVRPNLSYCKDDTILKSGSRLNYYLKEAFEHGNLKYFFHFQLEVLPLRWWQTLSAPQGALVDETIYSTLAYSRALLRLRWISEFEYQTFFHHYRCYEALLRAPTIIYYVRCDADTLRRRIRNRVRRHLGRTIETLYDRPYLDMLISCFEEVADELENFAKVQRVDSTRMSPKEIVARYAPET